MADSIDYRELVTSAYNEAEAAEGASNGAGEAAEPAPVDVVDAAGGGEPAPAAAQDNAGDAPTLEASTAASRARDEKGKFTKGGSKVVAPDRTKAADVAAPSSTAQVPPLAGGDSLKTPPAPAQDALRAPQSWTPAEREHFSKAPPEAQRAILRRERESALAMQESAPARRFAQEAHQLLEPISRARGLAPAQLIQNYAQADQMLSSPDPRMKAHAVAQLVRSYGVDINALAAALDGAPPPQPQQAQQPQRQYDPEALTAEVEQRIEQRLAGRQATAEVQKFYDNPTNEFLRGDHAQKVWVKMMSEVQAAGMLGEELSLADAYERATWGLPETRAIVQKRAAAEAAKASMASTQQARAAASSVKSTPSTGASAARTPKTYREMVEAAYDSLDGR